MDHVVAQYKHGTETITAKYNPDIAQAYCWMVSIIGHKFHGIEFHCRTKHSALWLFDQVVRARTADIDWNWLTEGSGSV